MDSDSYFLGVAAEFDKIVDLDDTVGDSGFFAERIKLLHAAEVARAVMAIAQGVAGEHGLRSRGPRPIGKTALGVDLGEQPRWG